MKIVRQMLSEKRKRKRRKVMIASLSAANNGLKRWNNWTDNINKFEFLKFLLC